MSSIATLVLSCPVSEILQVFCWKQHHTPIPPEFWGVPLDSIADVGASRREDPVLITRVINFELTQPVRLRYINVTDRRTDDFYRQQYRALHYVHGFHETVKGKETQRRDREFATEDLPDLRFLKQMKYDIQIRFASLRYLMINIIH